MRKIAYLFIGLFFASAVNADVEHYLRSAGSHVQHMKIVTDKNGDKHVRMDVDFVPSASDKNQNNCSVEIAGEAKKVSENELVVRKQSEGERRYCTLNIILQGDAATVKQSEDCGYFLGHLCKFDSEGETLKKVR